MNYLTDKQDRYYKNKRLSESNVHTSPTEHGFEKQLFDIFLKDPENSKDLDYYTRNLQKKLEMAKIYADTIDQCQKTITYIRQRLQTKSNNSVKNKLVVELEEQQKIYSRSLDDLKTVKNETYHLQSGLRKAEIKTIKMFKGWLECQQSSKFSTSFSTTGSREDVDNDNCFVCKSTQNTLRNSSAKDCSCEVRVEKQIPINW